MNDDQQQYQRNPEELSARAQRMYMWLEAIDRGLTPAALNSIACVLARLGMTPDADGNPVGTSPQLPQVDALAGEIDVLALAAAARAMDDVAR